ncbi:hypothetical protein VTN00DRAFT_8735 [Thermoascus crustaceus]|uniref:uncharacterized protein n=1 Tax=Thermoascus crustaceus TaxID=5088 RepID=UPI003743064E
MVVGRGEVEMGERAFGEAGAKAGCASQHSARLLARAIRPSGRLGAGEIGADLAAEARRDRVPLKPRGRRSRQEMCAARIAVGREARRERSSDPRVAWPSALSQGGAAPSDVPTAVAK